MAEKLTSPAPERTAEEIAADFEQWEDELTAPPDPGDTAEATADTTPSVPEVTPETDWLHEEIDALPDADIRYSDVELLGKRYPVRQAVREIGNQRMKAIESVQATWHNALDTPGKIRRQFSVSIAESRHNRQQARVDSLSHLPDTHVLKRRHIAKLARTEGKLNNAKEKLTARTHQMESRTSAVQENAESRREIYVKELLGRREAALARKTLRHELRANGAGVFEARSLLKEIPETHIRRVGRVAAQAETSHKAFGQAERQQSKAAKQETKILADIENNERLIARYTLEAEDAHKTLAELTGDNDDEQPGEGSLRYKESHLAELQSQLEELADDDPDRTSLQVQIDEAQHAVDIIKEREIPYWQSVAEKSARRAKNLEYERVKFRNRLENNKIAQANAGEVAEQHKQTLEEDLATRSTAAKTVLTNERNI